MSLDELRNCQGYYLRLKYRSSDFIYKLIFRKYKVEIFSNNNVLILCISLILSNEL